MQLSRSGKGGERGKRDGIKRANTDKEERGGGRIFCESDFYCERGRLENISGGAKVDRDLWTINKMGTGYVFIIFQLEKKRSFSVQVQ